MLVNVNGSQKAVSDTSNLRVIMTNYGPSYGSRVSISVSVRSRGPENEWLGARWGVPAPCWVANNYVIPFSQRETRWRSLKSISIIKKIQRYKDRKRRVS